MISCLFMLTDSLIEKLSEDHCGMRIISLYNAYGTKYNFCRFYQTDTGVMCVFYSTVVYCGESIDAETREFMLINSPVQIELSANSSVGLTLKGYKKIKRHQMLFPHKIDNNNVTIETEPNLHMVFDIAGKAFGIQDSKDLWFADMSHKVRHGISRVYKYKTSVAVNEYIVKNKAYFSHVATAEKDRGKGHASVLLMSAAYVLKREKLTGFLYAEEDLKGFYRKIGFESCGTDYIFERII